MWATHRLYPDSPEDKLRVPHTPGFPVGPVGINELHAAFLKESRTRNHGWRRVQEIRA
jgi:hypothetical protein